MKSREGVKVKNAEKDHLIAQLKKELEELRTQDRDYGKIQQEIVVLEGRYKMLQDEKSRGERDNLSR